MIVFPKPDRSPTCWADEQSKQQILLHKGADRQQITANKCQLLAASILSCVRSSTWRNVNHALDVQRQRRNTWLEFINRTQMTSKEDVQWLASVSG